MVNVYALVIKPDKVVSVIPRTHIVKQITDSCKLSFALHVCCSLHNKYILRREMGPLVG